jgi:hypothetical protein
MAHSVLLSVHSYKPSLRSPSMTTQANLGQKNALK